MFHSFVNSTFGDSKYTTLSEYYHEIGREFLPSKTIREVSLPLWTIWPLAWLSSSLSRRNPLFDPTLYALDTITHHLDFSNKRMLSWLPDWRNTNMIHINETKCLKCKVCVKDCIVKVLTIGDNGFPRVRPEDERFCLNCQHCLAVCPVGAVECHGVMAEQTAEIGPLPSSENMLNLLCQRRSIRQYKQEDLDAETMDMLVKSLAWTPTGCNDHRLFFTVVRHREEMDFFRDKMLKSLQFLIKTGIMRLVYPNFKRYMDEIMGGEDVIFRNAPHMVVACTPKNAPCREADPWIALSYFDLMAQSLGVGTCWCGFAVYAFKWVKALRERLGMPKGYQVGAVLLFGKPDVEYKRQTAPKPFRMNVL